MSATNRSVGPIKAILVMPLEQDIPELSNVFLGRTGLDLPIPLGAGQVWTCLYPWGGPGPKEFSTPLGLGRSGLAYTPGPGQIWTCQCL